MKQKLKKSVVSTLEQPWNKYLTLSKPCKLYFWGYFQQHLIIFSLSYDLPETHRVSLVLEDGSKLSIQPEMSSVTTIPFFLCCFSFF